MSEQIEQAARAMADDWNPDRDPILTAMFRDYANTLAAAGLLTPSDTFASTKPSDAERPEMVRADDWHTGWVIPVEAFDRWRLASAKSGEEAIQRLARAAFMVDGTHHFWVDELGRPVCLCGFIGNARKRTQTEHITSAVLEAFDHD